MKLEEKIHAKEVEKTNLQAKSKVAFEDSCLLEENLYWSDMFICWSNGLCLFRRVRKKRSKG